MTSIPRRVTPYAALAVVLLGVGACGGPSPSGSPGSSDAPVASSDGCISGFDANTDYFPDKVTFEDATNVTVRYEKSYKVVTVKQPYPGGAPATYVFVQCGAPEPKLEGELAKATKVTIPVHRVAAASTTQVNGYELLDKVDSLAAVGLASMISDGPVKDRVDEGKVIGFNDGSGNISVEKLTGANPDLYVTQGTSDPTDAKIAEAGIPVVADAEWLEKTALGRSEWTKFTALFLNAEKKATEVYGQIKKDYLATSAKGKSVTSRPTVLLGSMFKGTWYATASDSYLAAMIRDAGGEYILKEVAGTGSKPLDFEIVLDNGAKAQFWLNAQTSAPLWKTTADAVKDDARLGQLVPVKNGTVWNPTKIINAGGGNDYWQSGVVRPDLVLADMIAILHPDLMPGHTFTYYQQVPKG